MTTLELLITNKYLYLIASIILLFCLFIAIYELLKKRAQQVVSLSYQLTFELLNGDRLPFHPLSFGAHQHVINAIGSKVRRIVLVKDGHDILQYRVDQYPEAKDEVKRLAKLF